jgi:hypothetical protein
MLRWRALFCNLTLAICVAGCYWGQSLQGRAATALQTDQAMNFTVEGTVNTISQNKLTLRAEENVIFHVSYNDKTQFKSDDGSLTGAKDLRVGLAIRVEGDLMESGEIVAKRIELLKKK